MTLAAQARSEELNGSKRQASRQAVIGLAAGALGGFAAWLIVEHSGIFAQVIAGSGSLAAGTSRLHLQIALGAVFGGCVGIALGAARLRRDAAVGGSDARAALITAALGAATGAIGGALGLWLGQRLYDRLLEFATARDIITVGVAARCAGWGLVGLLIGASQGLARGRARSGLLAALGGACGGVSGGAVFEALELLAANPPLARLIGFVFVGSATGFLLEAVPALADQSVVIFTSAAWKRAMNNPFHHSPAQPLGTGANAQQPRQNAAKAHPAAQMVCIQGPYQGVIFPLMNDKTHLTVGRLTDSDVCLMNDRGVSRRHALIRRDPETGEYRLEDLRSANGTCINHKRIRPNYAQTLYIGDIVDFAGTSMRFEWVGAPPAYT